ncbi:hypothetical protein HK097_007316 [Rhizophlyctis rosea]|uniref:Uncharacterized protein n=1 Tax=Rhizophlyctis rosea TaxID=64517 RepID=A0AAD5SKC8_9FUNG|nr:hypothetical protein HK097_007316 [Rhizophlyctis rosea]
MVLTQFAATCARRQVHIGLRSFRHLAPPPTYLLTAARTFTHTPALQLVKKKTFHPTEDVQAEEASKLWLRFQKDDSEDFTLREYQIILRYIRSGLFNRFQNRDKMISEWGSRIEKHMRIHGHSPTSPIYNDLLQCQAGNLKATTDLLCKMTSDNVDPTHHRILLPVLKTYAMTGNHQKADQTYHLLCSRNDEALTHSATKVYLQGLSRGFYINQLVELVDSYRSLGKKLDAEMYQIVLAAYISEQNIPACFATMKEIQSEKHRIRRSDIVRVVRACIANGDVTAAWKGVQILEIIYKDAPLQSINLSIRVYAMDKKAQAAWKEFGKFEEGVAVETGTLKALGKVTLECLPPGVVIPTRWIENAGIPLGAAVYKRLLLMYRFNASSREGAARSAEEVLWKLVDLNAADAQDYAHVISAYAHSGQRHLMKTLLNVMRSKGVEVDSQILKSMVMSCYNRATESIEVESLRLVLGLLKEESKDLQSGVFALLDRDFPNDHPLQVAIKSEVSNSK